MRLSSEIIQVFVESMSVELSFLSSPCFCEQAFNKMVRISDRIILIFIFGLFITNAHIPGFSLLPFKRIGNSCYFVMMICIDIGVSFLLIEIPHLTGML